MLPKAPHPIHNPHCAVCSSPNWSRGHSSFSLSFPPPLLHRAVLYGAIGSACLRDGCNLGYIYPSRDTTTVRLLRRLRLL
jgi:hypothetical protein